MRKLCLILAILCALMIPAWIFIILPQVLWRIPPEWNWQSRNIGYLNWADSVSHKWAGEQSMLYEREKSIIKIDKVKKAVTIKDRYTIYDPVSGKITWEYIPEFIVNFKTGIHLAGKDREGYYLFPLHVQKQSYILSGEYYKKLPFSFVREDTIEGLKTYVFEFKGTTEYTESYAGTDKYPGIIPPKGQEIRAMNSFMIRYWVEPVSGEVVAVEEDDPEGDWIVDAKTGEKISPVCIWGSKIAGGAVVQLAYSARKRRAEILFKERVVPIGFAVLAAILGIAFLGMRKKSS